MSNETARQLETVLRDLERLIDSTYCGTKHSAIYGGVTRALAICEQERRETAADGRGVVTVVGDDVSFS